MGSDDGRERALLFSDIGCGGANNAQGWMGRIISVSSRVVFQPGAKRATYAASKAAIVGFIKSAAFDLAPHGMTVNADAHIARD